MENKQNHKRTLPEEWIGFHSLEKVSEVKPKYQRQRFNKLTSAIIISDERCIDCFLLHLSILTHTIVEFPHIIYGKTYRFINIRTQFDCDCLLIPKFVNVVQIPFSNYLRSHIDLRRAKHFMGQIFPLWRRQGSAIYTTLWQNTGFSMSPTYQKCPEKKKFWKSKRVWMVSLPLLYSNLVVKLIKRTGQRLSSYYVTFSPRPTSKAWCTLSKRMEFTRCPPKPTLNSTRTSRQNDTVKEHSSTIVN